MQKRLSPGCLMKRATPTQARVLAPGEYIPYGAHPVLIADTTVYDATRVEEMLRQ
ncbi:hypothetical protein ACIRP2_37325 [Streptomyces sp. NPDC101194]|uniref:hypothetical protein n=1 Tax=Streptomyces sp. NPDC101194 TaxID=3366127 RepID=UPI0037FC7223